MDDSRSTVSAAVVASAAARPTCGALLLAIDWVSDAKPDPD